MSIEKPKRMIGGSYYMGHPDVYFADQMDEYLATKDAEIESLKTVNNAVALEIVELRETLKDVYDYIKRNDLEYDNELNYRP